MNIIRSCSYTFANGITVVNATPHPLSFQDINGDKVIVPTSVPAGERSGPLVINARAMETQVSPYLVKTVFLATPEGEAIIKAINDEYDGEQNVMIVGSMIAVNAFPGKVVGLCPAPGFERVPPQDKLMRCDKFTVAS